jgi:hypothetical protein
VAETTIEFASHDPQRAREIIALGFEAMWNALHEAARCGSWLANSMVVSASDKNRASPKARYASLRNISYWGVRNPMEHKAIRRMALSERITDETRRQVKESLRAFSFGRFSSGSSPAIMVRTRRSLMARYSSLSH